MARANRPAKAAETKTAPETEPKTAPVAAPEPETETSVSAPEPAPPAPQEPPAPGASLFSDAPPPSPFAAKAQKAEVSSVNTAAGNEWLAGTCASCGATVTGRDRHAGGRYLGCFYECSGCGKTAVAHQEIVTR